MDCAAGNRIIILGAAGSGKSTFARTLHEKTGLPLIHLDNVWWKADRTHISREEFDRRLQEILQGEAWIVDGDYSRTYEPRFAACDTILFLDYGEEVCMRGTRSRTGGAGSKLPRQEPPGDLSPNRAIPGKTGDHLRDARASRRVDFQFGLKEKTRC